MKKSLILLFCILFLVACNKKEEPIIEPKPPIIRENSEELLAYGNTLTNINGSIPVVETKEYIYYRFQGSSLLKINRNDLKDVTVFYENETEITNLAYYDGYLYFIDRNADEQIAQLNRILIDNPEKETLTDVDYYDNILVIIEENLYYVNTNSYFEKSNLDGTKPQLFGYTMIMHPSFDGNYFFGAGYDINSSDERLRIYKTDYLNDQSSIFYDNTVASFVVPNPHGYAVFENSGAQFIFHVSNKDALAFELQEHYLNRPFTKEALGNYYGSYIEEDTYYEYNPETNTFQIADNTSEYYSVWKAYALGTPTTEFVLFETASGVLYYHEYDSKEAFQLFPVLVEEEENK